MGTLWLSTQTRVRRQLLGGAIVFEADGDVDDDEVDESAVSGYGLPAAILRPLYWL